MSDPLQVAAHPEKVIRQLDTHHRFFIALTAAILSLLAMHGHGVLTTRLVAAWDVYALVTLILAWFVITVKDPYEMRRTVSLQDSSRTFIFVAVVIAATVSLFAVIVLLGSAKNLGGASFAIHATLSVAAIVLSWTLVHTLFTLRYAHYYYYDARKFDRDKIKGGLIFPEDESPDYLDFAYFSFVIGMTCQVSDVQISSKVMRRLATIHGVISFAFNTAILAMFVNIVAGLI